MIPVPMGVATHAPNQVNFYIFLGVCSVPLSLFANIVSFPCWLDDLACGDQKKAFDELGQECARLDN